MLDDRALWTRTHADDRIVGSKDEDFPCLTGQPNDAGRSWWVRLDNCRNDALLAAFSSSFDMIVAAFDSMHAVIETVTRVAELSWTPKAKHLSAYRLHTHFECPRAAGT